MGGKEWWAFRSTGFKVCRREGDIISATSDAEGLFHLNLYFMSSTSSFLNFVFVFDMVVCLNHFITRSAQTVQHTLEGLWITSLPCAPIMRLISAKEQCQQQHAPHTPLLTHLSSGRFWGEIKNWVQVEGLRCPAVCLIRHQEPRCCDVCHGKHHADVPFPNGLVTLMLLAYLAL